MWSRNNLKVLKSDFYENIDADYYQVLPRLGASKPLNIHFDKDFDSYKILPMSELHFDQNKIKGIKRY